MSALRFAEDLVLSLFVIKNIKTERGNEAENRVVVPPFSFSRNGIRCYAVKLVRCHTGFDNLGGDGLPENNRRVGNLYGNEELTVPLAVRHQQHFLDRCFSGNLDTRFQLEGGKRGHNGTALLAISCTFLVPLIKSTESEEVYHRRMTIDSTSSYYTTHVVGKSKPYRRVASAVCFLRPAFVILAPVTVGLPVTNSSRYIWWNRSKRPMVCSVAHVMVHQQSALNSVVQ